MCGGGSSGSGDRMQQMAAEEAAQARQREIERAARLNFGAANINAAFDGRASDAKKLDLSSILANPQGATAGGTGTPTNTFTPAIGDTSYGYWSEDGTGGVDDNGWYWNDPTYVTGTPIALPTASPFPTKTTAPTDARRWDLADGYYVAQAADNGGARQWGLFNKSGDLMNSNDTLEGLSKSNYYYGGTDGVEKTGGIGDGYYQGVRDNVYTLGMADLTDQTNKARENLLYSLARAGLTQSSVGNQTQAELAQRQADATGKLSLQADDAVNKTKVGVEQERANALAQLYATENPDMAANNAITKSALILQDKPDYNPIGDIFQGLGQGIGTLVSGIRRSNAYSSGGSGSSGSNPYAGFGYSDGRII